VINDGHFSVALCGLRLDTQAGLFCVLLTITCAAPLGYDLSLRLHLLLWGLFVWERARVGALHRDHGSMALVFKQKRYAHRNSELGDLSFFNIDLLALHPGAGNVSQCFVGAIDPQPDRLFKTLG
jgi:hypothetical protein